MKRFRKGLAWFNVFVGAAAFAATSMAIHRTLPLPVVPVLHAKLDFFRRHKDEYDAIFIGSSRVYRQISPEVFDSELKAEGISIKSFNFGMDAMMPTETRFVLDEIFAQHPHRLKWVFVELSPIYADIPPLHKGTLRALYWHDVTETALMLRKALARAVHAQSWDKRVQAVGDLGAHLSLFIQNQSNLGRAAAQPQEKRPKPLSPEAALALASKPQMSDSPLTDEVLAESRGYIPLKLVSISGPMLVEYRLALAKKAKTKSQPDPFTDEALAGIATLSVRNNAMPVFIRTPTSAVLPSAPIDLVVFTFDDPERFPMLYDLAVRADSDHLNPHGAGIFSRMLAQRFAQHLQPSADVHSAPAPDLKSAAQR